MADKATVDLVQCSFPSSDEGERDSFTCVEYPGANKCTVPSCVQFVIVNVTAWAIAGVGQRPLQTSVWHVALCVRACRLQD